MRIIAVREPPSVFPPLVQESVGRDIGDRIYERLATLAPGGSTIDTLAFRPQLARSWERVDSLTWRFRLASDARWHDGQRVSAEDVVFSFKAFTDSTIVAGAGAALAGVWAERADSATVLVHFPRAHPEQLYDATWHVRILPRHIWGQRSPKEWPQDTALQHLVGSGAYRVQQWTRGETFILVADSSRKPQPAVQRIIFQFVSDPDAALNLMLSGAGDLIEQVGGPQAVERVARDTTLRLYRYPAAVYGFAAFQFAGRNGAPSVFTDRRVRQALTLAVDRLTLARAVFGPGAVVPVGPVSRLQWIGSDSVATLPFDTAKAGRLLEQSGWRRGPDGIRRLRGTPLAFTLLVPSTSASRRYAAEVLQAAWRDAGAKADIELVDFPVFQQRLGAGKFDVYLGAYLDEPSPRGLLDQWSRAGWSGLNYGHYANAVLDSLMHEALDATDVSRASERWRVVLDSLNADAPALFLYAPEQVAVASTRVSGVEVNPWSWLEGVERWRLDR